ALVANIIVAVVVSALVNATSAKTPVQI
ncbi:MAG: hypothetical protein JWL62_654, partial [Hyphomicrobiales bacterium]|nr:hypothetical protein [Hyphomicrobiales bacterium]